MSDAIATTQKVWNPKDDLIVENIPRRRQGMVETVSALSMVLLVGSTVLYLNLMLKNSAMDVLP